LYLNLYTFLLLGVEVNLKVDREAIPEVSLEVEVVVGCSLPISLDSESRVKVKGRVLRVMVKVM
jgi:hypothetical protein